MIKCNVKNCLHNNDGNCVLDNVVLEGDSFWMNGKYHTNMFCQTFIPKYNLNPSAKEDDWF